MCDMANGRMLKTLLVISCIFMFGCKQDVTFEKKQDSKIIESDKPAGEANSSGPSSATASVENGALIFKNRCSVCHGLEGVGTSMAPALKGNTFVKSSTKEQIMDVIANGRAGAAKKYSQFPADMPKNLLSENEKNDLSAYLFSL